MKRIVLAAWLVTGALHAFVPGTPSDSKLRGRKAPSHSHGRTDGPGPGPGCHRGGIQQSKSSKRCAEREEDERNVAAHSHGHKPSAGGDRESHLIRQERPGQPTGAL